MSKVSVCIASHNGEKYIKEQLKSILAQIKLDDEVIISDDGSTDNSIDIIKSFNDPRVKLLYLNHLECKKKNNYESNLEKIYSNFKNAIHHSTGEYIFLSDQDDIWFDNKYLTVMREFEKKNILLVVHDALILTENSEVNSRSNFALTSTPNDSFLNILMHNPYLGCCMAINRKLITLAFSRKKIVIPHDTWLAALSSLLYPKSISVITNPLMYHRVHEANASFFLKSENSVYFKFIYRIRILLQAILLMIKDKKFKK